jgi:uncharacterized membrane protein
MPSDVLDGIAGAAATAIELTTIALLLVGAAWALAGSLRGPVLRDRQDGAYRRLRNRLGRTILVALELLIIADIIQTIAVAPTFASLGVLASIVAIRTFLSFAIEVEIEGRWPWRQEGRSGSGRA